MYQNICTAMCKKKFSPKLRLVLSERKFRLTGSVAYGLASGAKCLLLGSRRILLILILRALVLHRLLRVAVSAFVRTGEQLLLQRLFREHGRAVSVLCLTSLLLVKPFHVAGRHSRRHRYWYLAQILPRRGYAHVSHRLTDDLSDRLQECVTEFCRTVRKFEAT